MQATKINKRIAEQTERIVRAVNASEIKDGRRNTILNALAAINKYAGKAQRMVESPTRRLFARHADYDARTQDDIAAQAKRQSGVLAALIQGRSISLEDSREFEVSQMHTVICRIRRRIERENMPYVLCDEWIRPEGDRRPYKRYWIINKPQTNNEQ